MRAGKSIAIVQACIPDYRIPFILKVIEAHPLTEIICGKSYFTADLKLFTEPSAGFHYVRNFYLFGNNFLVQPGAIGRAVKAEVAIVEFNPRIINTWATLLWRAVCGRKTILWGHLWGQRGPQGFARHARLLMLRLGDGIICYTRSQQAELRQIFPTYPSWAAGNSCVTREQCTVTEAPNATGCIVYVGRLIERKKPALLLEAFAQGLPRLPAGTRLILVGDGAERPSLRRRIDELGLNDRVDMPGHISTEAELRRIYARALVAVSPGYVGLSAIQAMAFGVPLLVSRDEPHSPEIEACKSGQTCAFFDTDSIPALAEALVGFCTVDSPWRTRRAQISEFIAKNYTFEGMVETFDKAINSAESPSVSPDCAGAAKTRANVRTAVIWAQFGPYHFARLEALKRLFGDENIIGIEMANRTSTYAWNSDARPRELITLVPHALVENVSALQVYRSALKVFRERRVAVVLVPSYWPVTSLAIILAAHTLGLKTVMMNDSHALTAKAKGALAMIKGLLVRSFDAALVAGTPQKAYFSSLGLPPEKIVLGYDVVDNRHFATTAAKARARAQEYREELGLPQRYFLNIGRMEWKKNIEVLIDAYREVRARMGSACPKLVLVGSGRLEPDLQAQCVANGLTVACVAASSRPDGPINADVYFMGFRQVEELPFFYALATVFILPSREEEWGLVVNEAMASGLPVLVSNVAGCGKDLVKPGENGFLFDPFQAGELSHHMETLVLNSALAAKMGEASSRFIAEWGCERFAAGARRTVAIAVGETRAEPDKIG
jgi:glycosyltransferase involved in cell wall biosynthesis